MKASPPLPSPSFTRKLLTDAQPQDATISRRSLEMPPSFPRNIPVVMATPSLFKAFYLLEISKKHRRALSSESLLQSSFHTTQYFNPEFDPTSEETEPAGIRSILHERLLEALEASIFEEKDIVLILDKVVCYVSFVNIAGSSNGESTGVQQE